MSALISICRLKTKKIYVDANMNEAKANVEGYCHSTSLHDGWKLRTAQSILCIFIYMLQEAENFDTVLLSAMQAILQKCVASFFTSLFLVSTFLHIYTRRNDISLLMFIWQ